MTKNRVHKEDFSKLSTGEFPIFNGPVDFLNHIGSSPWTSRATAIITTIFIGLCIGKKPK